MNTKMLNKNIRRSITGSLGRFLSIFSLMVLGVFAFVGLKVSGPDMRTTAEHFYAQHQLADLTVTSTYGLNQSDQKIIDQASGVKSVEYGYFKDVLVKGSNTSIRIFSAPKKLSTYQLISGKMPTTTGEIALDYLYQGKYKIGQTVTFTEQTSNGSYTLKNHSFKIVGFVKSSEYVDKNNFGQTTIGTGQLDGYAVATASLFNSDVYMIARLTYTSMQGLSPYASNFSSLSDKYQTALEKTLKNQAQKRLAALKQSSQAKLDQAKAQLKTSEQELAKQKAQLTAQESQVQAMQSAGLSDPTLSSQLTTAQAQLNKSQQELASSQANLDKQQATLNAMPLPVYSVEDRQTGDEGYQNFLDNSTRIDTLSNIFPVVLFAIAALVSLTTMTRFVEEERGNIGLLKALGYSNQQIWRKFLIYGLVSACAGAAVGTIVGHIVLPYVVFNAYSASSTFTNLILTFSWQWTLLAFLIAILCAVLPAYIVVRRELQEVPATLFLAKAPKAGSRIFLEYITPLWKRLSFTYKVTARNLFRYKQRMFMTIVGIAGCTALLVMGFGIRDSISGLGQQQFGNIVHYDLVDIYQDKLTNSSQKQLDDLLKSDKISSSSDVHYELLTKVAGPSKNTQQISLIVPNKPEDFKNFVSLKSRTTGKSLTLNDKGAIISEKLADLMNVKVGDVISIKDAENDTVHMKISGITEMYMGHYIFMDKAEYQNVFGKAFVENANLVSLKNKSDNSVNTISADFMKIPGMLAVSPNNTIQSTINDFLYGINSVMFVLIGCAILLAIVVIYNLTNINVSERIRELSTIKVLGFYDREVTMYIYRETILLSVIGIVAGFFLGAYFHNVIITMLPTDNIMFNPGLTVSNLVLSALITLLTTFALSLVVHMKLKNIDMLGALKSVD